MSRNISDHIRNQRRARPPVDPFEELDKRQAEQAAKAAKSASKGHTVSKDEPKRSVLDEVDEFLDSYHGRKKAKHGTVVDDDIPWTDPHHKSTPVRPTAVTKMLTAHTHPGPAATGHGRPHHYSSHYHTVGSHVPRCYENHKPMMVPSIERLIWGGSCSSPIINDADIYIGLDGHMRNTPRRWPWTPGHEVHFPIPDMGIPKDQEAFHKLVGWLSQRLRKGDKIHIGCIGGHGRTGMLLAALVATVGQTPDAITYVRQHYCPKAVESREQIDFLEARFGVTPVKPTKGGYGHSHYR